MQKQSIPLLKNDMDDKIAFEKAVIALLEIAVPLYAEKHNLSFELAKIELIKQMHSTARKQMGETNQEVRGSFDDLMLRYFSE